MKYSVWNPASRLYDYYETPDAAPTHAGAPPRAMSGAALGATPEQAAWPLPPGARRVGAGAMPQGRVAAVRSSGGGLGLGGVTETVQRHPLLSAAVGAVAYLLWRVR